MSRFVEYGVIKMQVQIEVKLAAEQVQNPYNHQYSVFPNGIIIWSS
jgi:hypothetical protein